MTIREKAYGLIDNLPEDSVRAVIQIMMRMVSAEEKKKDCVSSSLLKKKAFFALQEMRKQGKKYIFSDEERASALEKKYGSFDWNGGSQ